MKGWLGSLVLVLALSATSSVWAVEPDELLDDPVLEMRARELSKQLRCVVCQNQDIDSSNAGVARTMRTLLRERLIAGDTDGEIIAFFVGRYGDFVLFRPKTDGGGVFLWMFPFALLIYAAVMLFLMMRSRARTARSGLSPIDADEEN